MPTAPPQTVPQGWIQPINVADFAEDGSTLDTTETLQCFTSASTIATATVDPANNRRVLIAGHAPGVATITITAPGVPGGNSLVVQITVDPPPNLSRVDFVSADPDQQP